MTPNRPIELTEIADESDQCVLYLFGELSESATIAFEQKLADSPKLAATLEAQARNVDLLASTIQDSSLREQTTITTSTAPEIRWLAVATSIGLAACLGWLILSLDRSNVESESNVVLADRETLLIAKSWADDPVIQFESDVELDEDIPSVLEPETGTDDMAPSWMVVALASDIDATLTGDANDG